MRAFVPATAATKALVSVAMPDIRPSKLSAVRSAVSRLRAEPLIVAMVAHGLDRVSVGHVQGPRELRVVLSQGQLRGENAGHHARASRTHNRSGLRRLGHQRNRRPIVQPTEILADC